MYHLLAYHTQGGAAAQTNLDVPAVTDAVITQQQSHFVFTDDFRLGAAFAISATLTAARLNAPTMNAFGRHQIWPLESTGVQPAVIDDLPQIASYLNQPIQLPQNEQIAWEVTNTAVVAEDFLVLLWIFTPDHQRSVPNGIQRLTVRAKPGASFAAPTAIAATAYTWSGPSQISFEQNLRGGWYSVVNLFAEDPAALAIRLIFPRARQYDGRVLRPGVLTQQSFATRPSPTLRDGLGVMGKFHSFEPPQIEILTTTTANHTPDMRMDIVYHGEAEPTTY